MKEIISEDGVLVGEKGVDSLKKRCDRQRLKCMSVDKEKISVWKLVGLVEQPVRWRGGRRGGKQSGRNLLLCIVTHMIW